MKKTGLLILGMLLCATGNLFASDKPDDRGLLENLGINISGGISVQGKYQDSFKTPLDHPQWQSSSKSGANHRSDQNFRAKGYLDFYFGELGKTEWFGILQTVYDANDPDTETGEYNDPQIETGLFAFIMYRPFEFEEGRPFGITLGIQTIPQTMNGYFSNLFKGDFFDYDFPANLSAGLISAPAVTLDFHFNPDTGFGITYAKDVSYVSEFAAFINPDSATTGVFWFNAKKWGFGLNGAYQRVKGNRGSTEKKDTNNGNAYYEYSDKGYYHNILNGLLSYTFDVSKTSIKPYLGYQAMWGDETPLPDFNTVDVDNYSFEYLDYGPREFEGNMKTIGITIEKELWGKANKLAFEFTQIDVPDFDGIGGLKKGSVDQYIQNGLKNSDNAFIRSLQSIWPKTPVAGYNKSLLNFADIDFVFCFEHTIKLTQNITLGSFIYSLKAKDDDTLGNEAYITEKLLERITQKLENEVSLSPEIAASTANVIMNTMASTKIDASDPNSNTALEDIINDSRAAEWTDTYSIGVYISYAF